MKKVINLYKPLGLTPMQAVEKFKENFEKTGKSKFSKKNFAQISFGNRNYAKFSKENNSNYRGKKMGYSGKLDPLAEGVLIVLVQEETKKMRQYMKLDKEYEAEILFGLFTDTHDILGIPKKDNKKNINIVELKKKIKCLKGSYEQKIPVYSSYKIKGKPLFYYARHEKLNEVEIPKQTVSIKDIKIKSVYRISNKKLLKEVVRKINLVKGDFRQEEIKEKWKKLLLDEDNFLIVKIVINCSSGTYIRAIADDLGKDYGGGILFSLKRTRVGKFMIRDSIRVK